MQFDLRSLSEYQHKLDSRICEQHNISSKDTINERILAFMVELGELANETRCFKYWSYKDASENVVILEEYVDGIHFLISLCNEIGLDAIFDVSNNENNLIKQFIDVFAAASNLKMSFEKKTLTLLFEKYLILGNLLDFSQDKIISGYLRKNEINHQRQETNY
ncbi:dUTP diphosphatase [Erysipelotrichaceae bacterium OttesenSCG-928-M19]|nr:dUTP diphosphatase [Erysipelotrichaceae bacterium OttesenSCG-928-M19]